MILSEEILQQLTPVFRRVFNNNTIDVRLETTAADVQEWTSLTHMNLVAEVEEAFGVEFALAEVMAFRNVGDMVAAIQTKRA